MKFAFVELQLCRAISVFVVSQNNQLKTINIPKRDALGWYILLSFKGDVS